MNTKHAGAANELAATVWLLRQGYEVFRNVSQHGDTDLITLRDGVMQRIDVKAATYRVLADGTRKNYHSGRKLAEGVLLLTAYDDGTFSFEAPI